MVPPINRTQGAGTMAGVFIPANSGWNKWWILMWWIFTPSWVAYSVVTRDFTRGLSAFLALFMVPEALSIAKSDDGLPPLTHVIRSTLRNVQLSMPLITGVSGGVIATWTNTTYRLIGFATFAAGALGWLIAHFLAAYESDNPRVSEAEKQTDTRLA